MKKVTDPNTAIRNALISLEDLREEVRRRVPGASAVVIAYDSRSQEGGVVGLMDWHQELLPAERTDARRLSRFLARQIPKEAFEFLFTGMEQFEGASVMHLSTVQPVWRKVVESVHGYLQTSIVMSDDHVRNALWLLLAESDLPLGSVRVRWDPIHQRYRAASFHQRPDGTGLARLGKAARFGIDDQHDLAVARDLVAELARRLVPTLVADTLGDVLIAV